MRRLILSLALCLLAAVASAAEPDPRVLTKMRELPTLAERKVDRLVWTHAGPTSASAEPLVGEWTRITGTDSVHVRWAPPAVWAGVVERCRKHGARLVLCDSPKVPKLSTVTDVGELVEAEEKRWREIGRRVEATGLEVAAVVIDLESWAYGGDDDDNERIHAFNIGLCRAVRVVCGIEVPYVRLGHLSAAPLGNDRYGRYRAWRYTRPGEPAYGFAAYWYQPTNHQAEREILRRTIDNARLYGVNRGGIYMSLSSASVPWLCPGVELFPKVAGRMVSLPIDPNITHKRAAIFGNAWHQKTVNGGEGRNGVYLDTGKVKWLGVFPRIGQEKEAATAVHVVAFLRGIMGMGRDSELREIQKQTWEERRCLITARTAKRNQPALALRRGFIHGRAVRIARPRRDNSGNPTRAASLSWRPR